MTQPERFTYKLVWTWDKVTVHHQYFGNYQEALHHLEKHPQLIARIFDGEGRIIYQKRRG